MSLQSSKRVTLVLVILALSAASAFAKNERQLNIPSDASISGKTLRAGNYKVDWVSHSPEATVTFYSGKEAVATVEGKWVDRGSKYSQNAVLYANNPDGSRSIVELRFAGMSQALVLGSAASSS
jgi:hypothetical protein